MLEFNDYDHGAIKEFVVFALETEQNLRGYLRGYESDFRQLLRRLARDFHHQIHDFTPVHQVGPTVLPRDVRDISFLKQPVKSEILLSTKTTKFLVNISSGFFIKLGHMTFFQSLCSFAHILPSHYTGGGYGFQCKSCPTLQNLKKFAAALPSNRIQFGNAGQPIDNMMVF